MPSNCKPAVRWDESHRVPKRAARETSTAIKQSRGRGSDGIPIVSAHGIRGDLVPACWRVAIFVLGTPTISRRQCGTCLAEGGLRSGGRFGHQSGGVDPTVPQATTFWQMSLQFLPLSPAEENGRQNWYEGARVLRPQHNQSLKKITSCLSCFHMSICAFAY